MRILTLLLLTAFFTGCEQRIEAPASAPAEKSESNTTIVNPPAEEKKVESNTTIVTPPAVEEKTESTTTTTTP